MSKCKCGEHDCCLKCCEAFGKNNGVCAECCVNYLRTGKTVKKDSKNKEKSREG